jgi:HEAT repeat protein
MTITPESVELLLQSGDYGDRLRGLNQVRTLEPAAGFAVIQPLVTDSNARVRYGAVSQLATLGHQDLTRAGILLRERLRDSEPDVQAAAADAIAALKLKDAFEDLQALYTSSSEWLVKFSIVAALGELGDRRCFDLLADALNSGDELLQTVAVGALGELGDDRAVPLLLPLTTHPDWQIRYRAMQGLSQFRRPDVRSALECLATDDLAQIADAAREYLQGA